MRTTPATRPENAGWPSTPVRGWRPEARAPALTGGSGWWAPHSDHAERVGVGALELAAHVERQRAHDERGDDREPTEEPHLALVGDADRDEDPIGRAGDEDREHPREEGGAEGRPPGVVPGPLEQVVRPVVAGDPPFDPG